MPNRDLNNRDVRLRSLIALAVVLTGLVGLRIGRDGMANAFTGGTTYRLIAEHLVEQGVYSVDGLHPTGYRPPGYPLLLAGIRWLWVDGAQVLSLGANLLLDAGCLLLLLVLVDRLARAPKAVMLAGIVFVADLAFHHEAMAQRETMLYTLLLLGFFVAGSDREIGYGALLIMACASGLAWLTRPTGIALAPLLVMAAYFQSDVRSIGVRIARLVSVCCIFAAIVLPWQVRLYHSFDAPVLAGTTSGGLNLYQGNNPAADVLIPHVDVDAYLPEIEQRLRAEGIDAHDELGQDRRLKAEAIAYIKSDPIGFVRRAMVKTLALYSPVPTPLGSGTIDTTDEGIFLREYRYHKSMWTFLYSAHGVVLILLVGCAIVRWRRLAARCPRSVVLIVGYLLLVTALHAITFAETRFRLPLDPLMIALGATALLARPVSRSANQPTQRKS